MFGLIRKNSVIKLFAEELAQSQKKPIIGFMLEIIKK